MNVRRIHLVGFGSYVEQVSIDLPERGLVTVQGPNGAGKSAAFIEAIAAACWNRSLRGPALWREGEGGLIEVESDVASVSRARTAKGRGTLRWEMRDPADLAAARLAGQPLDGDDHESATKAQERLEKVVGDFDVWRRTSVLSSADAAHFALATDTERKLLLEQVLGLDRFDGALTACRADLRAALDIRSQLERDVDVARASLDAAREAHARAEEVLSGLGEPADPAALRSQAERLRRLGASSADLVRDARDRLRALDRARADADADARLARREADAIRARLAQRECPTCGQSVAHQHAGAQAQLDDAERRARPVRADDGRGALEAEVAELEEEHDRVRRRLADAEAAEAQASRSAQAHAAARQAADRALSRLQEWEERHGDAVTARRVHADAASELELCERVLGMRGVRATMLDRALGAVEGQANAWLRRLAFPGSLRLRSSTERQSGKVVDAISLEIEGAGGGKYKGASSGERRRADLALLVGLMEVAQAARGGRRGTLFVDEAADSLDAEGRAAFAQAMADLARERAVVVITHDAEMAAQMPATLRLRIEAGSVVRG